VQVRQQVRHRRLAGSSPSDPRARRFGAFEPRTGSEAHWCVRIRPRNPLNFLLLFTHRLQSTDLTSSRTQTDSNLSVVHLLMELGLLFPTIPM
jgi:hypothetical protein